MTTAVEFDGTLECNYGRDVVLCLGIEKLLIRHLSFGQRGEPVKGGVNKRDSTKGVISGMSTYVQIGHISVVMLLMVNLHDLPTDGGLKLA